MSFKSILTPVQPTPNCDQALPHIVDFAKRFDADLTGLYARAPVILADPWYLSADIVQILTEDDEASRKNAEQRFHTASASLGGQAHWQARRDFPNTALAIGAAGADLIVAYREKGPEGSTVRIPALVLEAGVPVLVLPDPAGQIGIDNILIAWRNTADARRAVTAALPMLGKASSVTVMQVATAISAEEAKAGLLVVSERLKLHGILAQTELVLKGHEADADVLLKFTRDRRIDMIVLGAYGHTRAREWVLGGMTQDLLNATPAPLFMVH